MFEGGILPIYQDEIYGHVGPTIGSFVKPRLAWALSPRGSDSVIAARLSLANQRQAASKSNWKSESV